MCECETAEGVGPFDGPVPFDVLAGIDMTGADDAPAFSGFDSYLVATYATEGLRARVAQLEAIHRRQQYRRHLLLLAAAVVVVSLLADARG